MGSPPVAPILHVLSAYLVLMPNIITVGRIPHLLLAEGKIHQYSQSAEAVLFSIQIQ